MQTAITRKRLLTEILIKDLLILAVLWGFYIPMSVGPILKMPPEIQESVNLTDGIPDGSSYYWRFRVVLYTHKS